MNASHSQPWYELLWFRLFLDQAGRALGAASPQAVANVAWALARCAALWWMAGTVN